MNDKEGMAVVGKITATPLEDILVEDGPLGVHQQVGSKRCFAVGEGYDCINSGS